MVQFPDELAAIHAAFAEPVTYTGAGLTAAAITAIAADEPSPEFIGAGASARRISFEVQVADLPSDPDKGDVIVHDGTSWTVIDITRRRDVAAWVLVVEESA